MLHLSYFKCNVFENIKEFNNIFNSTIKNIYHEICTYFKLYKLTDLFHLPIF